MFALLSCFELNNAPRTIWRADSICSTVTFSARAPSQLTRASISDECSWRISSDLFLI
jgi:hypothetical protein